MSQRDLILDQGDLVWRALRDLTLACEVALDPSTNQSIARERVGQRAREARELLDQINVASDERGQS